MSASQIFKVPKNLGRMNVFEATIYIKQIEHISRKWMCSSCYYDRLPTGRMRRDEDRTGDEDVVTVLVCIL